MIKIVLFVCIAHLCGATSRWPDHDISTLKLLQVVHRHGERSPVVFTSNDPFKSDQYWPAGLGELTLKGKYHMYKLGQFIRQEYTTYLGDEYSPREVYARSSLTDRCIESVSCLLSGAYPPKPKTWQWSEGSDADLGHLWQPFPIQTFMPGDDDLVLEQDKDCPAAWLEMAKIYNRPEITKYLNDNKDFLANLSSIAGNSVADLVSAGLFHNTLTVELANNYVWNHVWTEEEERNVVKRLQPIVDFYYNNNWDSPVIQRLRGGGIVGELNRNFRNVLARQNDKKVYLYSTHDTLLALLMTSLNIFNGLAPPFGASIFFELHQDSGKLNETDQGYFVKVYYHNSTEINSGTPHLLRWRDCSSLTDCPVDRYLNSTQHLLYTDFDKECKQQHN